MSYTVRILANAQRDLADVEAYYDERAPHETERCLDEIEAALGWYRLFEEERFVQVIAVLHHRRGDDALAERVP